MAAPFYLSLRSGCLQLGQGTQYLFLGLIIPEQILSHGGYRENAEPPRHLRDGRDSGGLCPPPTAEKTDIEKSLAMNQNFYPAICLPLSILPKPELRLALRCLLGSPHPVLLMLNS